MGGAILLYCRAGFERECAQEVTSLARAAGVEGYVKARPESGHAAFLPHPVAADVPFAAGLALSDFIFARQLVRDAVLVEGLAAGDRAAPLASAARALGSRFRSFVIEMPDTNEGKALASLTRPLAPHLARALAKAGVDARSALAPDRLHFFFIGSAACFVGRAGVDRSSPWPMGIPRLRMPRGAPSRAALKLAEAFLEFLGPEGIGHELRPGMTAVDLGASPGGWSWQLARHGLGVTAVDNGPMSPAVLETGQVKHLRADGFRYRPRAPVDWMVCDMVESPSRIATLAARWATEGWCRRSIFNLKLPMKTRLEEVLRCREIILGELRGREPRLRIRQLYHDREEVTAFLALEGQRR